MLKYFQKIVDEIYLHLMSYPRRRVSSANARQSRCYIYYLVSLRSTFALDTRLRGYDMKFERHS